MKIEKIMLQMGPGYSLDEKRLFAKMKELFAT